MVIKTLSLHELTQGVCIARGWTEDRALGSPTSWVWEKMGNPPEEGEGTVREEGQSLECVIPEAKEGKLSRKQQGSPVSNVTGGADRHKTQKWPLGLAMWRPLMTLTRTPFCGVKGKQA